MKESSRHLGLTMADLLMKDMTDFVCLVDLAHFFASFASDDIDIPRYYRLVPYFDVLVYCDLFVTLS